MNHMHTRIFFGIVLVTLMVLAYGSVLAGDEASHEASQLVTVTGTINQDYQLVTEQGTVYEVAEGETGDEMLRNIGEKVKAKGTVTQIENQKILDVVSYEVME